MKKRHQNFFHRFGSSSLSLSLSLGFIGGRVPEAYDHNDYMNNVNKKETFEIFPTVAFERGSHSSRARNPSGPLSPSVKGKSRGGPGEVW